MSDSLLGLDITIASSISGLEVIPEHARIYRYDYGYISWRSVDHAYSSMHRIDDEGVTWIRGHHEPNSPEAAALLVAYALGRTI